MPPKKKKSLDIVESPAKAKTIPKKKKSLVIVESPAKAKTIQKYLGDSFDVAASKGHIRDLPKSKFGIDIEAGWIPTGIFLTEKKN